MLGEDDFMDKAIIFGVFDFFSFHVCKALLNKGIEVNGVHVVESDKGLFTEEKRLEVGRNANFKEHLLLEFANQEEKDETMVTIIFSLYDLFMLYKEPILQDEAVTKLILQVIEQKLERSETVTFFLPIQMLTRSIDSQTFIPLQSFLDRAMQLTSKIQLIYLPAIYGPWQPATFLFQQSILTKIKRNAEFKEIREGTMDAIFIEDAIESAVETIEMRKPGSYLLESGMKNHWKMCAAYLNLDDYLATDRNSEELQIDNQIIRIPIKRVTSISKSITRQKQHIQNVLANRV